jgi:hypothetical protein
MAKTAMEKLQDCLDIQCSKGNWDYDPYMHGMANGMLLAKAIFEEREPTYLTAPKKWGRDKKGSAAPLAATEAYAKEDNHNG